MRLILSATASAVALLSTPALAQDAAAPESIEQGSSFGLGQIVVTGQRPEGLAIGADTVGQEAIEKFNRNTLDDAANLIPGVTAAQQRRIAQRAAVVRARVRPVPGAAVDRRHPRLSARRQPARLWPLPHARHRRDTGRQGLCLGARRARRDGRRGQPRHPQADQGVRSGSARRAQPRPRRRLHRLYGVRPGRHAAGQLVRAGKLCAQFPGPLGPVRRLRPDGANEDGGERDFSRTEDWRVNAKFGFTPNATDEYSISYTRQEGAKNAPLH